MRTFLAIIPALLVSHAAFAGNIVVKVPEPASLALLAAGVAGVALYRRKRK